MIPSLDGKLSSFGLAEIFRVRLECCLDLTSGSTEPLYNGRRSASVESGVQYFIQNVVDRRKVRGVADALDQVIGLALHLDNVGSLVAKDTDLFMAVLAGGTFRDHLHDDVLSGHEGELLHQVGADDLGVDNESCYGQRYGAKVRF